MNFFLREYDGIVKVRKEAVTMGRLAERLKGTLGRFFMVGCVNCLVGFSIMAICYNIFHLGYWISTASNYIISSTISYFLNSRFTFKDHGKSTWKTFLRFWINIAVCYFAAYSIAQPLIAALLSNASQVVADNVAMAAGMGLFSAFNYFGQMLFVFKRQNANDSLRAA